MSRRYTIGEIIAALPSDDKNIKLAILVTESTDPSRLVPIVTAIDIMIDKFIIDLVGDYVTLAKSSYKDRHGEIKQGVHLPGKDKWIAPKSDF